MYTANSEWLTRWQKEAGGMDEVSSVDYWNRRADDYDDFIRTSRFSYGRQIVRLLKKEQVLDKYDKVLEIAGGVGALTLPLCKAAKHVTSLEPAAKMAECLDNNLKTDNIRNCEVLQMTGQEYMGSAPAQRFDFGIICHASWQFPDLQDLVDYFSKICTRACIADTAPETDSGHSRLLESLGVKHAGFDRVYVLYNALWSLGTKANISFFNYTMRRSRQSAISMLKNVTGKYKQVTDTDMQKINKYVDANCTEGIYQEPACMAVIWWKTGRRP